MNFCSIYYVAQKKGVLNDSAKQALGMEVEKMVQAIEPYFDHADLINAVIFELNAKYNKIQKDEAGA